MFCIIALDEAQLAACRQDCGRPEEAQEIYEDIRRQDNVSVLRVLYQKLNT